MINLSKEKCTGCGACNNVCPNDSIKMVADKEGFLYPLVNAESCSLCGLCQTSCPVLNREGYKRDVAPKAYASWSLNDEVRLSSTSGGIFTELARSVILQGGYVAGARYNKAHLAEHYIIGSEDDIALLRQSKYVQSAIGVVFKDIKKLLDKGAPVMFVGSPCECGGLLSFLGRPYDSLLLCDFICRGANSPKAYLKYLESLKLQYGSDIKRVWFKNKINGWNKFCTKIEFENGSEYYADRYKDLFMRGYLKYNLYMRSSCYRCSFKGFPRQSDITLADFWGVELKDKSVDTDKGTSLVIINSEKGQRHFDELGDRVFKEENSLEAALPFNQCAVSSVGIGEKREYFFSEIDRTDFEVLISKIKETEK
ncbi:coenzyme F420-reducing hydrogenase beta subunit [Anaerobacterium chartisolvens]|uniref:Coenzyme F420-reducing hydrogenase beta subunit n=2 Tax=Anaerobacterium chartisolvens TaxID=1297424 RepID=A0A369AKE8_9FIRM|nr:coenzyme F420-reducing hydrogenase beta subunit [Anaerobacterium chartisolvens]